MTSKVKDHDNSLTKSMCELLKQIWSDKRFISDPSNLKVEIIKKGKYTYVV